MTRQSFADVDCGVAQAAQQVGDKWTLVILRDAFNGVNRYDDFARHLGVASNVLAARLSALVESRYPVPPPGAPATAAPSNTGSRPRVWSCTR